MKKGKAKPNYVVIVAGEPIEDQVFKVERRGKGGVEGTFVRNGFSCQYSGEIARKANAAEIKVALELAQKNRPPCPICGLFMTVHINPIFGGLTDWRCEEHGEIEEADRDG